MDSIFKAYDIRGIVGKTLTEDLARDIGRAFVTLLKCKKVVVGQDTRLHSDAMFNALTSGITMQGAEVIRLGLCSTPMLYFANGKLGADAGIMVTASHNPSEWNGFKLCRAQAVPISGDTGIREIEQIVLNKAFAPKPENPGSITTVDILPDFSANVKKMATVRRPLHIAADYANSMGVIEATPLRDLIKIDPLFEKLDGSFPNHEANPLKAETLKDLQAKVRSGKYDFGAAFDGDADRVGFLDEKGEIIPMDMITALVAQSILKKRKGIVLYDLRSSWSVAETIRESGGEPRMCRVGHAFIKQQMRDVQAIFAGEMSGHYYFQNNYFTESSAMAVLHVANLLSASDKPLSELIKPLRRYFKTDEINSRVKDTGAVLDRIRKKYADGKMLEMDGVSVEFADWWFNVRSSNTEPLVRLNMEAKSRELLDRRCEELLTLIRQ